MGVARGWPGRGFTGRESADIVGITYRQLDYWARTDLIRPTLSGTHGGSGSRRRYSYEDLLRLATVKALLDSGVRLERIREILGGWVEDLSMDAILVIGPSRVLIVQVSAELARALRACGDVVTVLRFEAIEHRIREAVRAIL